MNSPAIELRSSTSPPSHGSLYFDYGTSWNPDAESLSLSVGLVNGNVAPEENQSYEAGVKWSFLKERLLTEGAWFRTEKDNAHETNPTNSNQIVAAGNQLVKGVQLSAVGRLPEGMDLLLGYAYLDSAVIYSQFFPTAVGYPLANVPRQTFNLFVTHRLPWRFERRPRRQLCRQPHGKFNGALRAHGIRTESERAWLRGHQRGHEAGSRLLGLQRNVEAADRREAGVPGEREQHSRTAITSICRIPAT